MRPEMLAARVVGHAVVGSRAQRLRLPRLAGLAYEYDVSGDARRELAGAANEVQVVGEQKRVHANRQLLEGVAGVRRDIHLEIRRPQQIPETVAGRLLGEQQQRRRAGSP